MLVDILCGVLPGALYADLVYPRAPDGTALPSGIGHFFGALQVGAFRPLAEFKEAMDDLQRRLRETPRAEGHERIYIHGEKEFEKAEQRAREGIPLSHSVLAELQEIAADLNVAFEP
jgi:L-2-hydroxycarboxylate dehydrogenase (NAD+)